MPLPKPVTLTNTTSRRRRRTGEYPFACYSVLDYVYFGSSNTGIHCDIMERRHDAPALVRRQDRTGLNSRVLFILKTIQSTSGKLRTQSSSLFEEERDPGSRSLISQGFDPFLSERTGIAAAFAADDDPMNTRKIDFSEVLEKRLE